MGDKGRRVRLVAVLAALTAAGVSGCGGGSDRLTATELAAQGNSVCARSDKKLQKAFKDEFTGAKPTPEQMQAVLKRVVPITEETVSSLRELDPPKKLESRFEDALEEADEAISSLKKGAASAEAAEKVFSAAEDPFAKTNKRLEEVGITACSQGAGADGGGAEAGTATFRSTEYAFAGPTTLRAGKVTVTLLNSGKEDHEMNIVRLKDGVTAKQVVDTEAAGRDTEDLVADDEVGGVAPVAAGATGTVELNLVPGTYAYACFVEAPDGQPHVAKGMFGEFRVP